MGRYYYGKKTTAEECKTISIFRLKEWCLLKYTYRGGVITWTNGWGEKSSINYTLDLEEEYFELDYRIRSGGDEEWTNIKCKIPIVSTSCNYGGKRYWFKCSVFNNGIYCGRRVGKLYLGSGSNYFACRHCYNLSYDSRNINRRDSFGFLWQSIKLEKEIEKLEEKIKIPYRKGLPTKNQIKLIKKYRQMEGLIYSPEELSKLLK